MFSTLPGALPALRYFSARIGTACSHSSALGPSRSVFLNSCHDKMGVKITGLYRVSVRRHHVSEGDS